MSIIRVDDLTFRYNGLDVISNITFAVEKGIYLGIVGPNGSGKSTLIKNILGILQPEQGRVELFGKPLGHFPPVGENRLSAATAQRLERSFSRHGGRNRSNGSAEKRCGNSEAHAGDDGNRPSGLTSDR